MPDSMELLMEEARQLSRTLESVVVSIHRITSTDNGADGREQLWLYLADHGAWRALAEARHVLALAMDRQLGEEASAALVADVEYWSGPVA